MSFVIYKTTLSEFVKELRLSNGLRPSVYITTVIREREKDFNTCVLVLGAFNEVGKVIHFQNAINRVSKHDAAANERAKDKAKKEAERIRKYLENNGFSVRSGFLGVLENPTYGSIDVETEN